MHRRSLRFGLLTVLGLARQGFFIPYRYADTLPHPGTVPSYPASADRLARTSHGEMATSAAASNPSREP